MTKTTPLRALIIDDDQQDVAGLLYLMNQAEIGYDYVDTLEEGAIAIAEANEQGMDYDLIICDNHFYDSSFVEYDPNFNGVDLIGIVSGNTDLDENPRMRQLVDDYFGGNIETIQEHYLGKLVLFSGSAASEDPYLYCGIDLVQKFPDRDGQICETDLIGVMEDRGFSFQTSLDELIGYKQAYA